MAGYFICGYRVVDADRYQDYRSQVGATFTRFGGQVLVAHTEKNTLEGTPTDMIVVLAFPSVDDATAWYNSPEYAAIRPLRLAATTDGWALITAAFG